MSAQGPGKVFLEKSIKIQDRVTKWTESRTIARYTLALVAALEKPKLAGQSTILVGIECLRSSICMSPA